MQKIQKVIAGSALALGLLGGTMATSQTAEASQGYIMEGNQKPIVGIWVEVKGGKSGWARFNPTIRGQKYSVSWSYNTQNKPFSYILASEEPLKDGNTTSKQDFLRKTHMADK